MPEGAGTGAEHHRKPVIDYPLLRYRTIRMAKQGFFVFDRLGW